MKNVYLMVSLFFVMGCSQSLPKCGDTEVTDLVSKIVAESYGLEYVLGYKKYDVAKEEELRAKNYMDSVYGPKTKLTIDSIRTIEMNKQRNAYICSAQYELSGTIGDMDRVKNITYTVEITDKGDQFIVNVYDL